MEIKIKRKLLTSQIMLKAWLMWVQAQFHFCSFVHPSYNTTAGIIPSDDLSKGARAKISSSQSAFPPQLIQNNSY